MIKIFKNIKRGDWVISNWRSHYHALLHGIPEKKILKEIVKGKSMSLNFKQHKFVASSIVAGGIPIGLGIAVGIKKKKQKSKVFIFVGDMTFETGVFHEAYKYAKNYKLPVKFIVEDNGLSTNTPTKDAWINISKTKRCTLLQIQKRIPAPWNWILGFILMKSLKYKSELIRSMTYLAKDKRVIFLGQSVNFSGNAIYNTLAHIPKNKKIELPVFEDVQMGMSTGLALNGYVPVTCFPRFDFLILAMNQLVNHLDKIRFLSNNSFKPRVIIRTSIGSKSP